jgi:hypothetical protein
MAAQSVAALAAAYQACAAEPSPERCAALLRAAHDIKGMAGTFGYPLMGRLGASLARLTADCPGGLPMKLAQAHVAAIQLVLARDLKGDDDKPTLALLEELERQVAAATGKR